MLDELLHNILSRRLVVGTVGLQLLYGLVPLRNRTGLLPRKGLMACLRLCVKVVQLALEVLLLLL